jgi:hypothetical protein
MKLNTELGTRNAELETCSPSPEPAAAPRRLCGKVAKLPPDVRLIVNQMLDAGDTYKAIVARLTELGHPGFFEQNIQRWKDSGYQRWAQLQEKRLEAQLEAEAAAELAQDPKNIQNLVEANEIKLALKTSRLLDEIHAWDAETILIQNPRAFFQLSRSVTQQLAERTRRERFKFDVSTETKADVRPVSNATFARLESCLMGPPLPRSQATPSVAESIDLGHPSCGGLGKPLDKAEGPDQLGSQGALPSSSFVSSEPEAPLTSDAVRLPSPREGQGEGGSSSRSSVLSDLETSEGAQPILKPDSSPEPSLSRENGTSSQDTRHSLNRLRSSSPKAKTRQNTPDKNQPPTGLPSCGGAGQREGGPSSHLSVTSQLGTRSPKLETPPPISYWGLPPGRSVPISPLAQTPPSEKQPADHVPVFDLFGALVEWLPREGSGSQPKFENFAGFETRRGKTLCWLNPKRPHDLEPPVHWKIAILNPEGRIVGWTPHHITPSDTAQPLRARAYINFITAWVEGLPDPNRHDCRVGAAVA